MAAAIVAAAPSVASHPPSSPFASLLRQSRFATFDPAIRQTYSAPPAYAHRGNWGLKRPIALRRKNAFISLASFEAPAQYIEWNNAESQVRFIRRIEEMGATPRTKARTPWHMSLGKAQTEWLIDSEFCPGEGHILENTKTVTEDLRGLGKKGPGQYGMKRAKAPQATHITENIDAMSRKEFARYLKKVRALRPAFREHLERNVPNMAGKTLYSLSQNTEAMYHRKFLAEHTAQEFDNSLNIEQQPHPSGGLMYSHPSNMDTYFTTKLQPGLVLQMAPDNRHAYSGRRKETFVASFGGLGASLDKANAGGKRPLLNLASDKGIDQSTLQESIANMRLKPGSLELEAPPKVVGRNAQGLKAVKFTAEVVTDAGMKYGWDNQYVPGTQEYNAQTPRPPKAPLSDFTTRPALRHAASKTQKEESKSPVILSLLHNLMGTKGGIPPDSDHGL